MDLVYSYRKAYCTTTISWRLLNRTSSKSKQQEQLNISISINISIRTTTTTIISNRNFWEFIQSLFIYGRTLLSLGFGLVGADFSDPFQVGSGPEASESGFQFPHLDPHHSIGFRVFDFIVDASSGAAGEFDSNEWMHSLIGGTSGIGDSTDSSNLPSTYNAWQNNADFGFYASNPFATSPTRLSPSSDLN
ncbi:hypothetical protein K1719_002243 [Acacia pycnantha]|nr:hypothetical protein K1719_002243 [Acacia pycnantha]